MVVLVLLGGGLAGRMERPVCGIMKVSRSANWSRSESSSNSGISGSTAEDWI